MSFAGGSENLLGRYDNGLCSKTFCLFLYTVYTVIVSIQRLLSYLLLSVEGNYQLFREK